MRLTQGTFSFLPDLSEQQIARQVRYCLDQGWAINVEYTDDPHPRNTYWEMWGQPMFDLKDPAGVLYEIAECRKVFGNCYIRVSAFDSTPGWESLRLSFIVNRPEEEPGFDLERHETTGRRCSTHCAPYATGQADGRALLSFRRSLPATGAAGLRRGGPFFQRGSRRRIGYMNPHRLTWGFTYDFPLAMVVGVATIVAWLFSREPKSLPWHPLVLLLAIFAAWVSFTTLFAAYPDHAQAKWDRTIKVLLFNGFVTLGLITTRRRLDALIWVIVLSLGFFALKGAAFTLLTGGVHRLAGPPGSFIADNNSFGLALLMVVPLVRYLQLTSAQTLGASRPAVLDSLHPGGGAGHLFARRGGRARRHDGCAHPEVAPSDDVGIGRRHRACRRGAVHAGALARAGRFDCRLRRRRIGPGALPKLALRARSGARQPCRRWRLRNLQRQQSCDRFGLPQRAQHLFRSLGRAGLRRACSFSSLSVLAHTSAPGPWSAGRATMRTWLGRRISRRWSR